MERVESQTGLNDLSRIRALAGEVEELRRQVATLQLNRNAQTSHIYQWRWAKAVKISGGDDWPGYLETIFPIVWLDATFEEFRRSSSNPPDFYSRNWPQQSAEGQEYALSQEWIPEDAIVPVFLNEQGQYHILTPGLKRFVRFSLDAELTQADEKVDGSIELQIGRGLEHDDSESIKLYNRPRFNDVPNPYEYYGDAGVFGVAIFDSYVEVSTVIERRFYIIDLQCP